MAKNKKPKIKKFDYNYGAFWEIEELNYEKEDKPEKPKTKDK